MHTSFWPPRRYQPCPVAVVRLGARLLAAGLIWVVAVATALAQSESALGPVAGTASFTEGEARVVLPTLALLKKGQPVFEGQTIETGADGYVYINTVDRGFVSIRPNSLVRVERYRINTSESQASEIRWVLERGVVRIVSGQLGGRTKERFRLNTPVAAIGVRGTDFSVYATASLTRVSVAQGVIVLSPFSTDCVANAVGPCRSALAVDLPAGVSVAQISGLAERPQVLPTFDLSPDRLSPPRPDESAALKSSGVVPPAPGASADRSAALTPPGGSARSVSELRIANELVSPALPVFVNWGRWSALADVPPAATDVQTLLGANRQIVATLGPYLVMRDRESFLSMPKGGEFSFALNGYEAYVLDSKINRALPANIENPSLKINFTNNSFVTGFDVVNSTHRIDVRSQGGITVDGKIMGDLFNVNARVYGALAGPNGTQAAIIFNRPVEGSGISAIGATRWSR